MADLLTPEWTERLAAATENREEGAPGSSVTAALTIGKTKKAVFELAAGRVTPSDSEEPDVTVPVTGKQLEALVAGELSLSQAYMKGDIKPTGSTRALLHVLDVFEDPKVLDALSG